MDTAELNNALKQRMNDMVSMLYPNAKVRGSIAHLGGISGEAGESFHIYVSGPRIGCFIDRANEADKGGTPLYLWSKAKNITFSQAVKEAKDWLGIADNHVSVKKVKPKTYSQPNLAGRGVKRLEPETRAMDYLVMERKLDPLILHKNKIADCDNGEVIVFPYFDQVTGEKPQACHVKYLAVQRDVDGKKKMWSSDGTKRCLFGKLGIGEDERELIIAEGEIDALSWQSVGLPAVSVPNGVADQEWIELDWEWLERFEKIYISTDMDEPGREAAEKFARRLGLHRCYIVKLPLKDANECLLDGMSRDDFIRNLEDAKQIDLEEIKSAGAYTDNVWSLFEGKNGNSGYPVPWDGIPLRIRPGEFTVVSGYSGHGKTQMLNHLMIHLTALGAKIFDASLEVTPSKTLQMMTRTALAKRYPDNKQELEACINWLNESMYFYDYVGIANKSKILEAMAYARKRYGIDVFVIDSLFKCGVSGEDFNGQRTFMDELTSFARETGAHVILVAHARKSENEDKVPTKTDIAGSSDINNSAFNVLIMWRNKLKQRKYDEAVAKEEAMKAVEIQSWYDGKLRLDKQKFGEGEEKDLSLYFDSVSWQYWPKQHHRHAYFKQG
jgi:twinkle protein